MIDTGSSRNFIKPFDFLSGIVPLEHPFSVNSVNGSNLIKDKCKVVVFGHVTTFYLLPALSTFDGILGYKFLKEIECIIDTKNDIIKYRKGSIIFREQHSQDINLLTLDLQTVPEQVRKEFEHMLTINVNAFADPDRSLPYNTSVEAKLFTKSEDPIYSRSYPYPASVAEFVNSEIESLLREGIIQKSSSAYNSPIHVVGKKGTDEYGNPKHRLVIDFRKLNENTIPDKYPMPDIEVILSNLGKSKYFSTLDLKSGFHQIKMAESDRCKTAFSVKNG